MSEQIQQEYVSDRKTDHTIVYWYRDGKLVSEQAYVFE